MLPNRLISRMICKRTGSPQKSCGFATILFLVTPLAAQAERSYRNWSASFEGGWQAAVNLGPPEKNGLSRGQYFWLTNERDIRWSEDDRTITVIFQKPSGEVSPDSPRIVFQKEETGLRMSKEGLSPEEARAISDVVWRKGGPEPGHLSSSFDRNSPYSRSHKSGQFVLDVDTVPMPLARHAIRVFNDSNDLLPWINHKELTGEAFSSLLAQTQKPASNGNEGEENRMENIKLRMASNPSLPRGILDELWRQPIRPVWGAGLRLRIATHPRADPSWYPEFYKMLDSDDPAAAVLRGPLGSFEPLPADLVDLLIRRIGNQFDAERLASRKDLLPHQIASLIEKHAWDVLPSMIRNGTLPEERYKEALDLGSKDVMQEIMWKKDAPEAAVRKVLEMRVSDPKFHGRMDTRDALQEAVGDPRLPEQFHELHLAHPAPEIRAALAKNPSLSMELLRVLAADPFAVVAGTAREQLKVRANAESAAFLASLPPIESLNPAVSVDGEIAAALEADDPDRFETMRDLFETQPWQSLVGNAVKAGANACIRNQLEKKTWTRQALASNAAADGWTPEMTSLALTPPVAPETIEAYALSLTKRGKAEDFDVLLDGGYNLRTSSAPIAWHAVIRRDRDMLEKIVKLGAPLSLRHDGMTPAQLAVRIRFLGALGLLPFDEKAQRELAAFRERFPGDAKAPWLGAWTNGKSGFKTLVLKFNPEGTGALITATGIGTMTAWRRDPNDPNRFETHLFDDNGNELAGQSFTLEWKAEHIEARFPDRVETFKRPDPEGR